MHLTVLLPSPIPHMHTHMHPDMKSESIQAENEALKEKAEECTIDLEIIKQGDQ